MSKVGQIVTSPYLEIRNRAYYIAGSSVSLASVVHAFRQGASPETILQDFPQIGTLAKIYGTITFVLENPRIIEEYLADQERLWNELENRYPLSPDMVARFEQERKLLDPQSA